MTPTPDDLARSAEADLAVCEAASAGPWECAGLFPGGWRVTMTDQPAPHLVWARTTVATVEERRDADLIVLARTALPAWIRRAVAGQRFKDFVHSYLSAHGVPEGDPSNRHQQEGCRIGARLDLLLGERDAAWATARDERRIGRERIAELEAEIRDDMQRQYTLEARLALAEEERDELRKMHAAACDRIAQQSALLTQRAEKGATP